MIISFDLDGVIMRNPFGRGVFPWVRQHLRSAPELSSLSEEEANRRIDAAVNRIWMQRMQDGDLVGAYNWDEVLNEGSRELGGPAVPSVAGLVKKFCSEPGVIELLPGASEGLQLLHGQGFELKALTNGYRAYQQPVIDALGVEGFFSELLTPEGCGYAKPESGMFAASGASAHVGDTLVHDVYGANAAGLTSLWLQPDLPGAIAEASPAERARHEMFPEFLQKHFSGNPYTRFHPEASLAATQPHYVVKDVLEAAHVLLTLDS